jgi:hypothetical protein
LGPFIARSAAGRLAFIGDCQGRIDDDLDRRTREMRTGGRCAPLSERALATPHGLERSLAEAWNNSRLRFVLVGGASTASRRQRRTQRRSPNLERRDMRPSQPSAPSPPSPRNKAVLDGSNGPSNIGLHLPVATPRGHAQAGCEQVQQYVPPITTFRDISRHSLPSPLHEAGVVPTNPFDVVRSGEATMSRQAAIALFRTPALAVVALIVACGSQAGPAVQGGPQQSGRTAARPRRRPIIRTSPAFSPGRSGIGDRKGSARSQPPLRASTSRVARITASDCDRATLARASRAVKYAPQRTDLCGRLADGGGDVTEGHLKCLSPSQRHFQQLFGGQPRRARLLQRLPRRSDSQHNVRARHWTVASQEYAHRRR